ncbi:hypothetical protein A2W13_00230 [Candidatus Woesebacteria bacterium RBG_16_36_11]|uniref:Uncharacterized protein n=1 Tax=Candidatus Woesebacteria bacterium RBG_16_36_11 TaxID=1802481 RepID=A0A1F7X720_9BACT|nr:MAG: hypothetical protein A2W13_00230 [Candidatus Woesebacteria bacterium RBG_16_36_11]
MKKYIPFFTFWILNSLILFIFSVIFPNNIVFGNDVLSGVFAAFWTGFILTFLSWLAKPILAKFNFKLSGDRNRMLFYFVLNIILIWILARIPNFTGFGITRFTWAIILGLILELAEAGSWKLLKKNNLN